MFTSEKRVRVKEQRAQKHDRFLRGRQNAYIIYEHFRATGPHEAVQRLSDLFNIRLQSDDVQDLYVRWDQALSSASDTPSDVILEGLYKSKIKGHCSASDCLGFVRPRNRSKQWKHHIDQVMRTRNFRIRSDVVERRSLTKSSEGQKAYVERKMG